jgi:hypothetical protein
MLDRLGRQHQPGRRPYLIAPELPSPATDGWRRLGALLGRLLAAGADCHFHALGEAPVHPLKVFGTPWGLAIALARRRCLNSRDFSRTASGQLRAPGPKGDRMAARLSLQERI